MMYKILLCLFVSNVAAFSVPAQRTSSTTQLFLSTASAETKTDFYNAVQAAAGSTSSIDIDEYDRMATQLENYDGCTFEEGADLCDKEIQDRLDVAGVLRLKIELQLRQDYLEKANLFADDVRKGHDAEERQRVKAELIANREKHMEEGSDLGLW